MHDPEKLGDIIDEKVGEVRFEGLDISFGELLSLHESKELIIDPEYQRLFRWSEDQQSRLIESILLGLPIPQLFVTEDADGRFELIDGLQRFSSVMHFVQSPKDAVVGEPVEPDDGRSSMDIPLRLDGCDIVSQLNGLVYDDLPLPLRLKIKRASVRFIIIKKQSNPMLRYEMFKRLNTGGSSLSEQEVRNVTARIMGKDGIEFYKFLIDCAHNPHFARTIETLPNSERDRKQDEELVLRFFAFANWIEGYKNNISDFLTAYMEAVTLARGQVFEYGLQRRNFDQVFEILDNALGSDAFLRYRDGKFLGAVPPAYYEAITQGVFRYRDALANVAPVALATALTNVRTQDEFQKNVGPGANSRPKLQGRIQAVCDAIAAIL